MKVLLINPEFPDTYWSFRHALQFQRKRSAYPPLGLLTVSALLPKHWEQSLVDMQVRKLRRRDIRRADMVFVTAMLPQQDSLRRVVKLCQRLGKKVVLGGPFVSTTQVENLPAVDHIFRGEAEETLLQFAADLTAGNAKPVYEAIDKPAMSIVPKPNFSLIAKDFRYYSAMSLQYSRGCPFNCEFCDIIEIYGRVPRTKSNQQMIAEFDQLRDLGWEGTVFVVDDNFIGNKKRVREFLPELAAWQKANDYPFPLITEASTNLADDEDLLSMMRACWFKSVFLGIETPVEESLKEAQKMQNRGNLLEKVQLIRSFGLEVMAGFIVGFDNDPPNIFEILAEFIRKAAIPLSMIGPEVALPGTQLWKRLEREGRLLGESSGNHTVDRPNFKTVMDPEVLAKGLSLLKLQTYQAHVFYDRVLDSLRSTGQRVANWNRQPTLNDVAAFLRIVLRLGVLDSERKAFWRFFKQVRREFPDRLADCMKSAAIGFHFRKLNEEFLIE